MNQINHAIGYASDADIKLALNNSDGILEWETVEFTFVKSSAACVIVRAGAMGGDTYNVHGGWKFANPFKMEMAWQEILVVAGCYSSEGPSQLLRTAALRKA